MLPNRVQAGVREGGQYTTQARRESDVQLVDETLAGQSPVAIDQRLAQLLNERWEVQDSRRRAMEAMHYRVGDTLGGPRRDTWGMSDDEVVTACRARLDSEPSFYGREMWVRNLARWTAGAARLEELEALRAPMDDEYARRGGWARAFLVVGGDGHVHSSMGCSTCNRAGRATRFQWMTDFSGADEAAIVEAAGWRACTVCYPSAPVGDEHSLPTVMFSDEEKKQAVERSARAAKAEQARAGRIAKGLTPDGSPLRVTWVRKNAGGWDPRPGGRPGERDYVYRDRPDHEDFKTERAALQWYVQAKLWSDTGVGPDHSEAFAAIEQAIAAKRGVPVDHVRAELEGKVAARRKAR